jgi:hypothetical protein
MEIIKILAVLAALGTTVVLATGLRSMATGREILHRDSAHWMAMRVAVQAVAFGLVLLSFYS